MIPELSLKRYRYWPDVKKNKEGQKQQHMAIYGRVKSERHSGTASSLVFLGAEDAMDKVARDQAYLLMTNMTEKVTTTKIYKNYMTLWGYHSTSTESDK